MSYPEGYITGQSRDNNHNHMVAHLYKGDFANPGWPMCARGWNRDDGESYSIWRGNVGDAGICQNCLKRAQENKKPVPPKGWKTYLSFMVDGQERRIDRKKIVVNKGFDISGDEERFEATYGGYTIICSTEWKDRTKDKPYYAQCFHPDGGLIVDGWVGTTMEEAIIVCLENVHFKLK